MSAALAARIIRGKQEHGDRFDPSALASQFDRYYRTDQRIRVTTTYGTGPDAETYTRTGTVGMTSGWRPAYLLMRRSSDHGSSDVLGARDVVVAVQRRPGGPYVPVSA